MAVGLPLKTTYANGDVYSASDVNDTNGTINAYLAPSLGYAAGKNKIINGDFNINQRNFSSTTSDGVYTFDRWLTEVSSGGTFSAQTFTPGTAPVSGYESKNFLRIVTTGQSGAGVYTDLRYKVESVRTFAGQTATLSFWAKAASGTPKVAVEIQQNFGSGGSPSGTVVTYYSQVTLSTSWARYSVTMAVPSISGKTIGTNNNDSLNLNLWVSAGTTFNSDTGSMGIQSNTFDFWGVQWEQGSTATAFQTATGTIQGELAACQRYYWRNSTTSGTYGLGFASSTTGSRYLVNFPVSMRVSPTSLEYGAGVNATDLTTYNYAFTALTLNSPTLVCTRLDGTVASGQTAFRPQAIFGTGGTDYIGFSAEL